MPTNFNTLKNLYDNNQFVDLINDPDGIYWLKLRSISRAPQLRELCRRAGIDYEGIGYRQLFKHIYDNRPKEQASEELIKDLYEEERGKRRENEDYLISQLYQMKAFDWGGLYQNSLERTIVNNYVKQIQGWDELNSAIDNEIHMSMQGYVRCSWYNHWTSIIIEDIFKDHPKVLPAVGRVKKVDFFIADFPYDLKVTYFPDGYMKELRKDAGLSPEFTELKGFCRQEGIWYDRDKSKRELFPELLAKISEYPTESACDFIQSFAATRKQFVRSTIQDPTRLKVWLYENQGVRRFDAASRFYLILVNIDNLEVSWRLKRNKKLLADTINSHLDQISREHIEKLGIHFDWQGRVYETYADILFVVVHR